MQKSAAREREEEKRRLQAEMRRREQELLSKIKDQQRELESMKQEKGKVIFMILFLTLLLENLNECHKINWWLDFFFLFLKNTKRAWPPIDLHLIFDIL